MTNRSSRKGFGLIGVFLAILVVGIVACSSSATPLETPELPAPSAESPPISTSTASNIDGQSVPLGWDPVDTVVGEHRSLQLLEILGKLPLSFKDEGIWYTDYFRARELADAPQVSTLTEYLELSEDQRQTYDAANRSLLLEPGLLGAIRGDIREWDRSLGFSSFSVAVGVSTGEVSQEALPGEAAYMILDFDQQKFRQGLLDLGYAVGWENGVTYYDAPGSTLETTRSNPLSFAAYNGMKRVVLGARTLAVGGTWEIDLVLSMPGAAQGDIPSLDDDTAFSRLAASMGDALSAALLTRSMVLEPEVAKPPRYGKPEEWGDLHQWEALGMGYGISEGSPWMALSLFYPDPDAAEADAGELTLRMSDYDSAIPLTHLDLSQEQLTAMLANGRNQPINAICGTLKPTFSSDGNGSTLTIRCDIVDEPGRHNIWWTALLDMRDLGFLLP